MHVTIDGRVELTVTALAGALRAVARSSLVGIYVHGSSVLGDFVAGRSDLDLLVVVRDDVEEHMLDAMVDVLLESQVAPASGVEASVLDVSEASATRAPWPFRRHATTAPEDRKVVSGVDHPGDPDLALHHVVVRDAGWAVDGPPSREVFGAVERDVVIEHLAAELRWAAAEAPTGYAVLNSCRALRYVADGVVCSKTAGGEWALGRGIEPALLRAALAERRGEGAPPDAELARAWVREVADQLSTR